MRILVLGGTRFIGRHIVECLLGAGHRVSVFARGKSPDELPRDVERLRGDRNTGAAGLAALVGPSWDVCIDVSGYTPPQVRTSADQLSTKIGRYIFVSTVSVYQDRPGGPLLETHALLPGGGEDVTDIPGKSYGNLKVTCEKIVCDKYGDRCTILRPQIVAGPYDPTGRYTYWVQRAMQGGEMLAPGDGQDFVQVVDARDIARFTLGVVERGLSGIFNMAGPRLTWRAFMRALDAAHPVWIDAASIAAAGLTLAELPLFIPDGSPDRSLLNVSCARATEMGFTVTEPRITIADTRVWLRAHPAAPALKPERELELIARMRRS